jgi:hypothetical protein
MNPDSSARTGEPLHRLARVLLGIVTVLLGIVALAGIVIVVLSSTNWGH